MKIWTILIAISLSFSLFSFSQTPTLNHTATWTSELTNNGGYMDIWGYHANGREYAIISHFSYVFFVEVTDPFNPILIASFPGSNSPTRDVKTYRDRAYVSGNTAGLAIYDLSGLPYEVREVHNGFDYIDGAHNIFIDEDEGRLYSTRGKIFDLSNDPDDPVLIAEGSATRGHDLFVRDNIAYVSKGSPGYAIYDVSQADDPIQLVSVQTNGYNHSSWLTEDNRYAVFAEETRGLPLGIIDLKDIRENDLSIVSYFKEPLLAPEDENSIPHNPFIREDFVFVSYYEDGVLVFDISDVNNPKRVAFYDTYPDNTSYNGFQGCWGVYPFLPSGTIIASDQAYGLVVMQFDGFKYHGDNPITDDPATRKTCRVVPNPTTDNIRIWLHEEEVGNEVNLELYNTQGSLIKTESRFINGFEVETFEIDFLPKGTYFLKVEESFGTSTCKIVKM